VITGGSAQLPNLGNFIYDLSGYRVRTGYAQKTFSHADCDGLGETSAATSIGLLLAARDEMGNCAQEEVDTDKGFPSVEMPQVASDTMESIAGKDAMEIFNSMPDAPAKESFYTSTEPQADEKNEEEPVQTTIFRDDEIEKVEVIKPIKEKPGKRPIRVLWTRLENFAAGLYDNVNQETND
jgi:hypothetical protein